MSSASLSSDSDVGKRALPDVIEDRDHAFDLIVSEDHVRALRRLVGEWRLVEPGDLHHAVGRQVLDDHLNEPELVGRKRRVAQVQVERSGRRLTVEPDEGADEQPEAVRLLAGAGDIGLGASTGFGEHSFQGHSRHPG